MSAQSNVIPLRPLGHLFEEAWRVMPSTMKKRSMSREKLLPLWRDHARKVGEEALLGALLAYVSDEDCRKWGGQALDRWLKAGRYDHYLEQSLPTAPTSSAFPNLAVWTAIVDTFGEPWAKSYISPYGWDEETARLIIPRTRITAIERLKERAAKLKACGVMGLKLAD